MRYGSFFSYVFFLTILCFSYFTCRYLQIKIMQFFLFVFILKCIGRTKLYFPILWKAFTLELNDRYDKHF